MTLGHESEPDIIKISKREKRGVDASQPGSDVDKGATRAVDIDTRTRPKSPYGPSTKYSVRKGVSRNQRHPHARR
jgi:hypothetical protein